MEIDCKATEIEQLISKLNETASLSSADNDHEDNQVRSKIGMHLHVFARISLLKNAHFIAIIRRIHLFSHCRRTPCLKVGLVCQISRTYVATAGSDNLLSYHHAK